MGVASSSSSDDVDARWTRDENVDEDAGEDGEKKKKKASLPARAVPGPASLPECGPEA